MHAAVLRVPAAVLLLCAASCGGAEETSPAPVPAKPESLTTVRSEVTVTDTIPGTEDTVCIHKRLGNAEAGFVRKVRGTLDTGSHHLIAYVSDATEEQLEPEPCGGFSGILVFDEGGVPGLDSANVPIFIAQQPFVEVAMPTDGGHPVGFRIEKDQMLRFELHWFNVTSEPQDVTGAIELDMLSEQDATAAGVIESSFAFWGTMDIDIPPHTVATTPVLFQRALTETKSFAVTTHQHHLGTRMRVWHSDGDTVDDSRLLADSTTWAEPPLEMLDPPLAFAPLEGLAYQCEWNNTTDQQVGFGEEFNDEMCFLWSYYYPSAGFDICVHFAEGSQQGVCNHLIR